MRQQLLIDADDTLWENNIYFEAAFEQFVDFLEHSTLTAPQIRAVLDEIELANSKAQGLFQACTAGATQKASTTPATPIHPFNRFDMYFSLQVDSPLSSSGIPVTTTQGLPRPRRRSGAAAPPHWSGRR